MERREFLTGWGYGVLALPALLVSCLARRETHPVDPGNLNMASPKREGMGVISDRNREKLTGWGSGGLAPEGGIHLVPGVEDAPSMMVESDGVYLHAGYDEAGEKVYVSVEELTKLLGENA